MDSRDQERMDALTEAILRQRKRQDEVERRLARIEEALGLKPAPEPAAAPGIPPAPEAAAPPQPAFETPVDAAQPPVTEPPAATVQTPPRPAFETRIGLTWINRIGVITLVLGIAFFFKYAVDNQWIGETGRVVLGIVAGFATLGIGDRVWRRGQEIFAQGISGAGIAILYLSFYAAFGFYHLIPQSLAFVLMALNTAASGALALRYGSATIAALGLIGGYLTPALLSTGVDRPWFLFGYILLLNAGAVLVARARGWWGIDVLAFFGTAVLYISWLVSFFKPEKRLVANVFALAYYGLFATRDIRGVFLGAQLIAAIELLAVSLPQPYPFLPLAALICATGLLIADRHEWPEAPIGVFGSFWAPYAVAHLAFRQHASAGSIFVFLTVIFLLFFAWIPWRSQIRGLAVRSQDLILAALNVATYFGVSSNLLEPGYAAYIGLFAVALAGLHVALGYGLWRSARRDVRTVLLYLGISLALLTLAAPIQFTGFRITIVWALETAALAWIAARTREVRLRYAALAVGFLALVRLAFLDASIHPAEAFWNVRFLTFATTAVCFWLAAYWMNLGRTALAAYLAGHGAMLAGLIIEMLAWAAQIASPGSLRSIQSTSVSMLLAAYAVLLVAIGVAARSAVNRILGLGLIVAVVVKLYFYDVWRIERIYRVAAFAALGVFLLVTSYLYSRYRSSIEHWWKDEGAGRGQGSIEFSATLASCAPLWLSAAPN
ncbi:MAG: DUF2339 domain-containing protein [Acidobacteria bacterium]|nr:DUF2339 domain-containing protein [Acidobacteriota bacterium]